MKMRWGLTTRTLVYSLSLVVGTSLILGVVYTWIVFQNAVRGKSEDARVFARAVSQNAEPFVLLNDIQGLQRLADTHGQDESIDRISFYDAERQLLASQPQPASDVLNIAEGVTLPLTRDAYHLQRTSDGFTLLVPIWPAHEQLELGLPAAETFDPAEDTALGFVEFVYTMQETKREMTRLAMLTGLVTLIVIFSVWAITIILVRRFLRPIHQLVDSTSAIASGNLTHRASEEAFGEVGLLAQSFNHMAEKLQDLYASIEQQVEERTAQLAHRTSDLEREISQRQAVESELRQSRDAAEAANRAKSEFLANMSHELRTPLNGVIGMTDLLLSAGLNEKQMHFAHTAKLSANALLNQISDILDLSKVEAGKLELDRVVFDLTKTIEDVAELMAYKASEKGLELTCYIDPEISAEFKGDPSRIQQIVTNLVSNAVKFTDKGDVSIEASKKAETEDAVTILVKVRDTGMGIPKNRVQDLFQPFSQIDASTTRKYGGTGLGLRISKQLVELMEGEIGLESEVDQGSTFWFTMRLQKTSGTDRSPSRPFKLPETKGRPVLVVDDNATNREILCQHLTNWAMKPEAAKDGFDALDLLDRSAGTDGEFALVILDMHMPGMDGTQLARSIRRHRSLHDIPMIMLSSVSEELTKSSLEDLRFSSWISKPVKQSVLLDTILHALSEDESHRQVSAAKPSALPVDEGAAKREARSEFRLLVVEDNLINQDVVVSILSAAGYGVDVADNGVAALQKVETPQFDLIIMDCQMPEMDGFEATRRIRELERQRPVAAKDRVRIPIIALTANALQGDRERCLESGMDDYQSKPLDARALVRAIDRFLLDVDDDRQDAPPEPPERSEPATSPAPEAGTPAYFDLPDLMDRCMGDTNVILKLLHKFETESHRLLAAIDDALGEEALLKVAETAHGLKGMSANLSAVHLCQSAATLEQCAKQGNLESTCRAVLSLRETMEATLQEISSIPQHLTSGPGTNHGGRAE